MARRSWEILSFTRRARVGFDQVDKIPGNGSRGDLPQQGSQGHQGNHALQQSPDGAPGSDVNRTHFQDQAVGDGFLKQIQIVDPDDFSSENVDDLLIEQVASQQEHAFRALALGPVGRGELVRIPPLIEVTDTKGSSRSPVLVLMISTATRARSSCGTSATSRTLPQRLPAVSNTGVPSSSVSAKVSMSPRILN